MLVKYPPAPGETARFASVLVSSREKRRFAWKKKGRAARRVVARNASVLVSVLSCVGRVREAVRTMTLLPQVVVSGATLERRRDASLGRALRHVDAHARARGTQPRTLRRRRRRRHRRLRSTKSVWHSLVVGSKGQKRDSQVSRAYFRDERFKE